MWGLGVDGGFNGQHVGQIRTLSDEHPIVGGLPVGSALWDKRV
jgi:hypothetical protein